MRFFQVLALVLFFFSVRVSAEVRYQLITKLAVFPIADFSDKKSEDAWWQIRETLTKNQRFLVASRRFMINRGVFQPRKSLKAADIIILGKVLDAEALVTTYLTDRNLSLRVYKTEDGSTLWEQNLELHPAIPISDQIIKASQKLISDFVLALPYQAHQVIVEPQTKPVFDFEGESHATVFLGLNSGVHIGDPVQWVDVRGDSGQPFFNQALRVQILAEGKVVDIQNQVAEVKIEKTRSLDEIHDKALIRFPQEMNQLKSQLNQEKGVSLESEYLSSEMRDPSEFEAGHKGSATALAFIGNLAALLLIAF